MRILFAILITFSSFTYASSAITQTISPAEIQNFNQFPSEVKSIIEEALTLTKLNLTYTYGSANPKNGGMDCSGTVYYLLNKMHVSNPPRDSVGMYHWAQQQGKFHTVTKADFNSSEFAQLKPGDLLFWSGTYRTNRNPPISHVMIYLGKNKEGQPLMVGSSDGRTYQGKKMWGVSVFDFRLPSSESRAKFLGYSCIPRFTCS